MHATKWKTAVVAKPLRQATQVWAGGDNIGEQTSKHGVSSSVSTVMTGFALRVKLPDSKVMIMMSVWTACCVFTWSLILLAMLCPG